MAGRGRGAAHGWGDPEARRFSTRVPWAALTATLVLSFAWKALCLDEPAWSEAIHYRLYCYSDIAALWFTRGFSEGLVPYLTEPLEYPPLIGLQIAVTAYFTRSAAGGVGWFFTLNALVNAAAAAWILWALRRLTPDTARTLWWAAAPPLFLYAFHNWDLPALAFLVGAVLAHRSGDDGLSGVAVGLGASAKLMPALALPVLVITRLKERRPMAALRITLATVGAWATVNLPLAWVAPDAWSRFFRFSAEREVTAATVWAVFHRWGLLVAAPDNVNRLSAVAFGLGAVLILWYGVVRLHAGRMWTVILPLLAWFLLTTKVFSPQFDLWPVPFLALVAGPAMVVSFLVVDLSAFFAEFSFLGRETPFGWVSAATLVRAAVLAWIIFACVRSAPRLHPHPGVGGLLGEGDAVPNGREVGEGCQR